LAFPLVFSIATLRLRFTPQNFSLSTFILNEAADGSFLRNRSIENSLDTTLLLKQRVGTFRNGRRKPKANYTYAEKIDVHSLRSFTPIFSAQTTKGIYRLLPLDSRLLHSLPSLRNRQTSGVYCE